MRGSLAVLSIGSMFGLGLLGGGCDLGLDDTVEPASQSLVECHIGGELPASTEDFTAETSTGFDNFTVMYARLTANRGDLRPLIDSIDLRRFERLRPGLGSFDAEPGWSPEKPVKSAGGRAAPPNNTVALNIAVSYKDPRRPEVFFTTHWYGGADAFC